MATTWLQTRDALSVVRSWADCTINMAGCDFDTLRRSLRGARARPPRAYFRFHVKLCTHLTTNFALSPELCSSHCPIFYSTNFWDDSRFRGRQVSRYKLASSPVR